MIAVGCNVMPVKYALAFAIIVLSLAGAYYLMQQAEQPASQQQVQEQPAATAASTGTSTQNATNTTCTPSVSATSYFLNATSDTLTLFLSYNDCLVNITVVFAGNVVYTGPPEEKLEIPVGMDVQTGQTFSFRLKVDGKEVGAWTVLAR